MNKSNHFDQVIAKKQVPAGLGYISGDDRAMPVIIYMYRLPRMERWKAYDQGNSVVLFSCYMYTRLTFSLSKR